MRAPGGGDRAVSADIGVRPRVAGITRGGTAGLRSGAQSRRRWGEAAVVVDVCRGVPAAACRELEYDGGVGGGKGAVGVEVAFRRRVAAPDLWPAPPL